MASISVYIASSLLLLVCISFCTEDTDFYTLLDIEKDADNREIRKAFKKLALKMHPDKNTVSISIQIFPNYLIDIE